MKVEYKRDLNCNYLILHGDSEIDTGIYQVRMLTANVISSLLPCHLQNIDGMPIFYFDITSKHSLASLMEQKKLTKRELEMVYSEILHSVEELSSFLMNHDFLWLKPEGIYVDVEQEKLYFCCIPGYAEDLKKQMKELTEYLLPKLDHEDMSTVNLAYKLYRVMLEGDYQIDEIKEVLYGNDSSESGQYILEEIDISRDTGLEYREHTEKIEPTRIAESFFNDKSDKQEESGEHTDRGQKAMIVSLSVSVVLLILIAGYRRMGYLSWMDSRVMIGIMIAVGLSGVICAYIWSRRERKQEPDMPLVSDTPKREHPETESDAAKRKSLDAEPDMKNRKIPNLEPDMAKKRYLDAEQYSIKKESSDKASEDTQKGTKWIGNTERLIDNPKKGTGSLVSQGNGTVRIIVLERDVTILGKLPVAVDEVLEYPTVSRIHAKIRKIEGEYFISDLNSRNGTFVNGKILQEGEEVKLENQDILTLGELQFVFAT